MLVTIHDVNDNEPIFDQSFYNVSVAENEAKGRCILKVSNHCDKKARNKTFDAVFGTILSQNVHFYVNLRKLLTLRYCGRAVLLVKEFTIYMFSSFFMIFPSSAA